MLINFLASADIFQKGLFLMIVGILFVFLVQTVFYMTVKIWLGLGKKKES